MIIPIYAQKFEQYKPILNRLLKHDFQVFQIPKDDPILDVGCGLGDDVLALGRQGYNRIRGIDADIDMVRKANNANITQGDIAATGFSDQTFSAVFVHNIFHHLEGYDAAIGEIARILKSRGHLCFIEPRNSILRGIMDWLTFKCPGIRMIPWVKIRYDVMIEELNSGLYMKFMLATPEFLEKVKCHFDILWIKRSWFFLFCKARKKDVIAPSF